MDSRLDNRYIVIKRKSLEDWQKKALNSVLVASSILTVDCVVVESDWAIYPQVIDMVLGERPKPESPATGMSDKIPSMSINVKGRPINPDIIDALALELKAVAQGLRDGTCILSENSGFCLTINDEETSLFASMSFPKVKAPVS